jgi:hypothetical protein
MVTPDKERRYVGGAFIALNEKMRERLWARVNAKAKPLKGVKVKPGTLWLKPGLVGRVRHLRSELLLGMRRCARSGRHANRVSPKLARYGYALSFRISVAICPSFVSCARMRYLTNSV